MLVIVLSPVTCCREECKHIQDNNGYLVCDDYQVGLVFSNSETVFALTATQPIDKYSGQWQDVGDSSKSHRAAGISLATADTTSTYLLYIFLNR